MVSFQLIQKVVFTITLVPILLNMGSFTRAQDSLPFDTILEPAVNSTETDAKPRQAGATRTQITATEPITPRLTNGWVGRSVGELVDELVDYGWLVVTETPSLVQLDRHHQSLDLHINRRRGTVVEVEVFSP